MKINTVLIRYNEIALKGGNRLKFEKRLVANIKFALKQKIPGIEFTMKKADGRIYVRLDGNECRQARAPAIATRDFRDDPLGSGETLDSESTGR